MSSYTTTNSEIHVGHVRSGLETANPPVTHQGTRSNPCSDVAGAAQTYPHGCHVKQRVKCPDQEHPEAGPALTGQGNSSLTSTGLKCDEAPPRGDRDGASSTRRCD